MAVFKRWFSKRITSKHPKYADAVWWLDKTLNGQRIRQAIPEARTKEEAETAEREIVARSYRRKYGIADNVTTFKGFAEGQYTRYVEQHNVNKGAKTLYIRLLVERLGDRLLTDITPQDCRDVQHALTLKKNYRKVDGSPLSESSVNRIMSTASKIFALACQEGILDRNPMQYVQPFKEPPPRKRLLTNEEKVRLWEELEKDTLLMRLVTLAVNLPLRRGQLLAITPDAIDMENGSLLATSSKQRPPRLLPLNSTAASTLRLMMTEQQLPFPLKDFRKRWSKALINAGINKEGGTRGENFSFHDLRKWYATELIKRNVNPSVVQRLFAHSSMAITDVYVDSDMDMMRAAAESLDADVQQTEVVQ